MDDVRAVMDAAGAERAALFGFELGANLCAVFAAAQPSRVVACVLHGAVARGQRASDYPWGWNAERWEGYLDGIDRRWGSQEFTDEMAREYYPSHAADPVFRRELASFFRAAASPGAALVFEGLLRDTDIRDVLPAIQVPVLVTHRVGDPTAMIDEGRYIAANIPGARLLELDGSDHYPFSGDQEPLMAAIERFLGAAHSEDVDFDRILATVLFTDLVGSTASRSPAGLTAKGRPRRHPRPFDTSAEDALPFAAVPLPGGRAKRAGTPVRTLGAFDARWGGAV